jgi:amidase
VLRHFHVATALADVHADPALRDRLKPEALWEVEQGLRISAVEVGRASKTRTQWYQVVRALFERFDYLALPSTQVFPFGADVYWPKEISGRPMDTYHRWMEVVIPVTMSGCPAINLPVGFGAAGLPTGLQLVAPNHGELSLLSLAAAYESATGWVERRPPPLLSRR